MSEIRQDQATKRWVIMATERGKRPQDLAATVSSTEPEPEYSPDCPFCPGNESKTPPEVLAYREEGGPLWRLAYLRFSLSWVTMGNGDK